MLGVGFWIQGQIESGVINRTGATTALYVDSFVAPNLQEFGLSGELSPLYAERLRSLLQDTPLGRQIVSFKVWDTRGKLLYSTDPELAGRTFPMSESMLRARLGEVVTTISPLEDEENAALAAEHDELLETYSPVWLSGTSEIIAVAEFYQQTGELEREIATARRASWFVVGATILVVFLLLSGFVRRASETIENQKSELSQKVDQLSQLIERNRELHDRVRRAAASVSLLNEGYLRRIGAELHDGPAQQLGLSLLNLDRILSDIEKGEPVPNDKVREALSEVELLMRSALQEMRTMAAGLSLPQLADLDPSATVVRAVRSHERRTGSKVILEFEELPAEAGMPVKTTVYRLIQEALNNAYLHADGAGQRVSVRVVKQRLVVEVADSGPGFRPQGADTTGEHLGLSGMKERVESLGGEFEVESRIGVGTVIKATVPVNSENGGQL